MRDDSDFTKIIEKLMSFIENKIETGEGNPHDEKVLIGYLETLRILLPSSISPCVNCKKEEQLRHCSRWGYACELRRKYDRRVEDASREWKHIASKVGFKVIYYTGDSNASMFRKATIHDYYKFVKTHMDRGGCCTPVDRDFDERYWRCKVALQDCILSDEYGTDSMEVIAPVGVEVLSAGGHNEVLHTIDGTINGSSPKYIDMFNDVAKLVYDPTYTPPSDMDLNTTTTTTTTTGTDAIGMGFIVFVFILMVIAVMIINS
jgi:hypothetical protein